MVCSISVVFSWEWGEEFNFFLFGFANITGKAGIAWDIMQSYMFILANVRNLVQTRNNLVLSNLVLPDSPLNGAL